MPVKKPGARAKAPSGEPLRFLYNAIIADQGPCILWPFGTNNGYGKLWFAGRVEGAHRMALEAWDGPAPVGREACHKCGNRACINPLHLYWGTRQENVNDKMAALGRVRGWRSAWVSP